MSRNIKAIELKPGQTVSSVTTLSCNGRDTDTYQLRQQPTVVSADFTEKGEGGQPTVYLTLSDHPCPAFHLAPDDDVTIEEPS